MNLVFYNNTAAEWLIAIGIALGVSLGLYALKTVLVRRLAILAARAETKLYGIVVTALGATHLYVLAVLGIFVGSRYLTLAPRVDQFLTRAGVTVGLIQGAVWIDNALRGWLAEYRAARSDEPGRATSAAAIGFVSRIVLWSVLGLMLLDNLGFNITTLVASLGIGGIAVALAVQNILGDLFASLSIVLDKPFVIGDFINVNEVRGTVEYIGLKTTRVRSLNGEQIIFSNADLLKTRIHNMKRMETRRAVLSVAVPFDTPEPQLRAIPGLIADMIKAQPQARFDRSHFTGVGPASLNFEAVYFVNSPEYVVHMDIQQEIQFELIKCFAERGVKFALPTQTLHLVEANGGQAAMASAASVEVAGADQAARR